MLKQFQTIEELFEEIQKDREKAGQRVKDWQEQVKEGDYFIQIVNFDSETLTIYGEITVSSYEEDKALYQQPYMEHYRLARCFSKYCMEGELGEIHVSTIYCLISKELFEQAKILNWP